MTAFGDKMRARNMTLEGAEIPDPKPMAPPVGYVKQPSMFEQVRKMMAAEFMRRQGDDSVETPEDAADMGDDSDPDGDMADVLSQYETYDLQMELARRTDAERAAALVDVQAPAETAVPAPPSDGPEPSRKPGKPAKRADGGSKAPVDEPGEQ